MSISSTSYLCIRVSRHHLYTCLFHSCHQSLGCSTLPLVHHFSVLLLRTVPQHHRGQLLNAIVRARVLNDLLQQLDSVLRFHQVAIFIRVDLKCTKQTKQPWKQNHNYKQQLTHNSHLSFPIAPSLTFVRLANAHTAQCWHCGWWKHRTSRNIGSILR